MKKLRLGFSSTFGTAEKFFTGVLGERYHVEVVKPEECDYLIFGDPNFGEEHYKYQNCVRILYTGENFRPNYWTYDRAITFDHENSPKHYRLPLYVPEMHMYKAEGVTSDVLHLNSLLSKTDADVPSGFCTFVQSNPNQPIRNHFVETLSKYKQVDCGGPLFNNIGYVLPRDDPRHKMDFVKQRKFNIAFENGTYPGYVTEKILDALYAGVIPIYFGSSFVHRDFNPDRFINVHDYTNFNEVVEVVKEIDSDRSKWLKMVNQPVWKNNVPPACVNTDNFLDWWETFVHYG